MHLKGCESTTCASSKAFVFFFALGNPVLAQSPEESREVLRTGVGIHDLSGELREAQKGKDWKQEDQHGDVGQVQWLWAPEQGTGIMGPDRDD